ncbi:MAG TPA: hypothetical protein VGL38_11095 [bacterium]|jgi:hypothetical protein
MKSIVLAFVLIGLLGVPAFARAAEPSSTDMPELCSLLALFSAHASSTDGVRLNWTLDKQSPTITMFRIYRGYEELGNFAVVAEVPVHTTKDAMEYSFTDSTVRSGVSYFYKLAALGQKSESVFPVVITATPPMPGEGDSRELVPIAIVKGDKIALYVRDGGHVKLAIALPAKTLVDDNLKPGIYEFDPPANAKSGLKLHLEHEKGYKTDVTWPTK